jgi:uncharacterized membrane protein YeaQ/YmgE (transglycosylase-associated protein family)
MEWSFDPVGWSLIMTIFFGAVCGYTASRLLGGEGFGFLGNIVVGIIGGYLGTWVVKVTKIPLMSGFFGNLVSSVGGALMLIFFIELIKYMRRTNQTGRRSKVRR